MNLVSFYLYRVDYKYKQPAMTTQGTMYVIAKTAIATNRYSNKYIKETYKDSYAIEIVAKVESNIVHVVK